MLLAYLEQPALQEDIARQIGTHPWGTPASNILRLTTWGFRVQYGTASLMNLRGYLETGIAPIVFVRTSELPYWHEDTPHAVVAIGMDTEAIHLLDPAYPEETPVAVSIGDFALAWSHFDQAIAIIEKS
jgi:hypothetical protein